jgi:predicted phosphoribosyltransferase
MEGTNQSRSELRRLGQELIDRVTQQYVYHRVVTELKARNMTIVDEEVAEDRTVKIRVRSW